MAEVLISPGLIEIQLDVPDKEAGLSILCEKLLSTDLVEEGFYQHIIAREESYPTGLPTSIPVALCHTEAQFVKSSALAVATLKSPVMFQEMGTPENLLGVEVIFLLALKDPKDQVAWLKKMVGLFQNRSALEKIRHAGSRDELSEFLKQSFDSQVA
jgi:PTS system galactitol-specific IIA component